MKKSSASLQKHTGSTNGLTVSRVFKNYWQLYAMLLLPVLYILIYNYGPSKTIPPVSECSEVPGRD